jgi:glycosyltransferase involved in cell wall biosynthesis
MESSKGSVLFVINSFARGGAERVFLTDIQILEKAGYTVSVATLYNKGILAENLTLTQGSVHELQAKTFWSALVRVRALLVTRNYHTVISTLNEANTVARIACLLLPVRLITREANMAEAKGIKHMLADILFGFRSNSIIAVSRAVQKSIVAYAPWLTQKTHVIYNGVELSERSKQHGSAHRLLTVGSLTEKKDHQILITALLLLPDTVTLTIVGEGSQRNELERLVDVLDLRGRVFLVGGLSHEEVMNTYQEHNLFVLPSRYEGCPNVISEAQSMGLPCIAFSIPGIDEFISSESGIVVAERSERALADAIMELVSDSEKRERMGKSGFDEVSRTRSLSVHEKQVLDLLSNT